MDLRERIEATGDGAIAAELLQELDSCSSDAAEQRWSKVSQWLCRQNARFETHLIVRHHCFGEDGVPQPMWLPDEESLSNSHIAKFLKEKSFGSYDEFYQWSVSDRAAFWQTTIDRLDLRFERPPSATVDLSDGIESPRWLPDAAFSVVDWCFQADPDSPAIVADAGDGEVTQISVSQLRADVLQVAGSLQAAGFGPGDRIAIMMPMVPESVAIYLGIIAAGCAAVSIADSFAAPEIRTRLNIAEATGIFCLAAYERAGRTIDLYSRVREADAPRAFVIGETTLREGDTGYADFLKQGTPLTQPVTAGADHHINVLFSSGTTGDPKAIPWSQSVPIKCAADGMWHQDIREGDVVVWPTNIGWMMGPWLIFAGLMNKAAIGLAPLGDGFGAFVQKAGVTMLGVVPTLVRAWRESRCMESCDWTSIRCFSSTGEASSPEDMLYLSWLAGYRPVIEYCGGTEVGGGYICSSVVQPNVPGCFSTPALGSEFVILDDQGQAADTGELHLVPPAIGLSTELLNRDHHETYYSGVPADPTGQGRTLRRHGDHFERLPGGYYRAGGRADDTMNLGGIKVSSAEIERVLNLVEGVSETAAVAMSPAGGGPSQLIVFVVATEDCDRDQLPASLTAAIKTGLNPLFRISGVHFVDALPRTASNKVMRRQLRAQIAELRE